MRVYTGVSTMMMDDMMGMCGMRAMLCAHNSGSPCFISVVGC